MCDRNINWLPLVCPPPGDLAHNPGMCLEGNQTHSNGGTQSNEPHQPREVYTVIEW